MGDLKIKSIQSFGCAHRGRIYVRIFIEMSAYTCMSIYIYTMFLKNITSNLHRNGMLGVRGR
jgi:hypothetical protein